MFTNRIGFSKIIPVFKPDTKSVLGSRVEGFLGSTARDFLIMPFNQVAVATKLIDSLRFISYLFKRFNGDTVREMPVTVFEKSETAETSPQYVGYEAREAAKDAAEVGKATTESSKLESKDLAFDSEKDPKAVQHQLDFELHKKEVHQKAEAIRQEWFEADLRKIEKEREREAAKEREREASSQTLEERGMSQESSISDDRAGNL